MAQRIPLSIGGIQSSALLAMPQGRGPFPGAVVTFHRGGLDSFTEWMVDDLAAQGFAAIAPDHFHVIPAGQGPDDRGKYMTDEQLAADLAAAARWLKQNQPIHGDKLAILGPCMGGRNVLVAAECDPDLWGCICAWYGGNSFKPLLGKLPAPAERDRLALITCPIDYYSGGLDVNPSPADVDRLEALLRDLGKSAQFHRYADAHHGFLNSLTGRPGHYHDAAAKDSWAKAMRFMRQHLGAAAAVG